MPFPTEPVAAWSGTEGRNKFTFAPDDRMRDRGGCSVAPQADLHHRDRPTCFGCGSSIVGRYVTAGERTYHRDCFKCGSCHLQIDGKYFLDEKGLRCGSCHAAAAPKCGACRRPILGRFVQTGDGQKYHQECFVCTSCRHELDGSYFTDKEWGFMCKRCHERKYPPEYCGGCKKVLEGRYVTVEGTKFHPSCFKCAECRRPIDGSYLKNEQGHGYTCSDCGPRCDICRESLSGHQSISIDGRKIHAACFRCCDCRQQIGNQPSITVDVGRHRCRACHVDDIEATEALEERHRVKKEWRLKRRNTADFRLEWRPDLVPCSRRALQAMGVQDQHLPRSRMVCVCLDMKSGAVGCTSAPRRCDAAVNISYLSCALLLLKHYKREPQFSLDPADPHDIAGERQVKMFFPSWLQGTVVGEILFQADYALKELCIGDRSFPGLPNVFDEWSTTEATACRQWFVVREAGVTLSADGALVPHCRLGVDARRLVPSPKGFVDAAYTDPQEPMVRLARAVTDRFADVACAPGFEAVGELVAFARAMVVARFLLERGCRLNETVMDRFSAPMCPEGADYSMEIPTLRKQRRSSCVHEVGDSIQLQQQSRSMHGGVDLGLPTKKVPSRVATERLLDDQHDDCYRGKESYEQRRPCERPTLLPLFSPPLAAKAA